MINEYSVDENRQILFIHKLPYIERAQKLKVENKSTNAISKDLKQRMAVLQQEMADMRKELADMQKLLAEKDEKMLNWQIAAQAVEAYAILLWREPLAIPKSTKARLMKLNIDNVLQLRSQSYRHRNDDDRKDRTQLASDVYQRIPLHYRTILEDLVHKKFRCATDGMSIAHPPVRKSQIVTFLAPYLTQQNMATDLLRRVSSLKVLGEDDMTYVYMFQEG